MRRSKANPFLYYKVIAYGVFSLLLTSLLCTCDPAPKAASTTLVGNVRYDEGSQILNVDLAIDPVPDGFPSLFGSAMPALPAAGTGHFRGRRTLPFTSPIKLAVPCASTPCLLEVAFTPPFADSIPAVINKKESVRFAAGSTGLSATENLVTFFEPADRSAPRRILLQGPTSTGMLKLPKEALSDIPVGKYQVYLVKQQLQKDSLSTMQSSVQTEYFTRTIPVEIKE
ncbi:hypothetical protein [Neolewinella persica]|uniref:hypothetical protein n=1 Tax=Neolewinella persica TaxID=70998 RepID=UPI000376ECDD|nr:hypothetical protein [Neolewinella persica]